MFGDTDGENAESSDDNPRWFRNRKKLNEQDLNNLHPHVRSKYLAVRKFLPVNKTKLEPGLVAAMCENNTHFMIDYTANIPLLISVPRSLLFFVVDSVCLSICPFVCHKHCFFFFVSRWYRAIFWPSVLHDKNYKTVFFDF